jgi:hypothetical protein
MKKFLVTIAAIVCLTAGAFFVKAQDAKEPDSGINGKWHFVLDTPGGDRELDAEFAVDADGKVTGMFGTTSVTGTYKDGNMNLDFAFTSEESGETAQMKLVGKQDSPSGLKGTWQFSSYDGTFTAFRPKK